MSGATSNTTDNVAAIDGGRFSQTIVREAPDAIVYADAQGIIRFWNHGAERTFGFALPPWRIALQSCVATAGNQVS